MSTKYTLGGSDVDPKHYAAMLDVVEKVAAQHAEALDRTIAEFYLSRCKTYPDLALSDLVLIEDSSKPLTVKIAVHPDAVLRHQERGEGEAMKPNKNGDIFDLSAEATYLETYKLLALGFDPLTLRESAASAAIAEKAGTMKQPVLYTITINGVDVTPQVVISSVRLTRDKPGDLARACEFSLRNDNGKLSFYGPSLYDEEGTLRHQLWHSRSAQGKKLLVPTMHVLAHAEEDPMSVEVYEDERRVFEGHIARADAIHSTQTIYVSCALGCVEKESAPSPLDPSWALEAKHCKAYFNGTDAGYCLEGVVSWAKSSATFYPALDYADLKYFTDAVWNDGSCTVKVYHEDHEEVPYTLGSANGHESKGTSTSIRRNLLFSGTVVYIGRSAHDENRVVCCVVVDRAYPPPISDPAPKVEPERSLAQGLAELKENLEKHALMPSTMFVTDRSREEIMQYAVSGSLPNYGTQISVPDSYLVNFPGDADPSTVLELHLPHRGPADANPRLQPVLVVKLDGSVEVKPGWNKRMTDLAVAWWRAMAQVYHALPLPVSPKQEAIIAWCTTHHMDLAEFDRQYYAKPTSGGAWEIVAISGVKL